MNPHPVILILEDERPQVLALRATLDALGTIVDFGDPELALDFIQSQPIDAAVVDIHFPHRELNGIDFIRAVRASDTDLAIIIRTGDTGEEIADNAISLRAFRRVVKGRTSVKDMRELTAAAIQETRERRRITRDASCTEGMSRRLEDTVGAIEDELTAAECYIGLVQSLRNQLTAVAGFAETWAALADARGDRQATEFATQNKRVVHRMLADLNSFLDGPFSGAHDVTARNSRADVNATLDALKKRLSAGGPWAAERKAAKVTTLVEPLLVSAHPMRLFTALRHATEYCLKVAPPNSSVELNPSYVPDIDRHVAAIREQPLVFNRPARSVPSGYVCFSLTAAGVAPSLDDLRQQFHRYPEDPRAANLHMISASLGEENCTIIARTTAAGFAIELCVPAAT